MKRTQLMLVVLMFGLAVPAVAELEPCEDERYGPRARCGSITVLEDRGKADGRRIDLNVVILVAERDEGRAALFALAGGPGQGATDLAELALGPWAPALGARDVVLVDQRGTGGSNKLDCPVDPEGDPASVFGNLFDPEDIRSCLEHVSKHSDPRRYGSLEVVADLEEVRKQLGYRQVILWGGSGGTRTALVWMKEHPKSIEAVLLDGVTPTWFRSPSPFAPGAQVSLDRVFADCAAQPSCREAYPDLRGDFDRALALFDDGPVETSIARRDGSRASVQMHRGDFGYAVRGVLYRARSSADLPRLIHEVATSGDPGEFAQLYWQRQVGLRPFVAMGVHFGVVCTEDMPFIDEKTLPEQTAGTFIGRYLLEQYGGACAEWVRSELPEDYLEPVTADIPVLLISGYYDPSTPSYLADEVAQHLPNSRHLVVRNEGHGAEFGCARQLALDFLESGSLKGLGPACEEAGPIVFEVP